MSEFVSADPGNLYLPPSRSNGADPSKFIRQVGRFGSSLAGMPPLQATRGKDGNLRINDGVTRATRAAKLRPGEPITVEIIHELPTLDVTRMPRVRERLP